MENAKRLGVNGLVKNMNDGKVEAIFEGAENSVDTLIELCKRGHGAARVDNIIVKGLEFKGKIIGFRIY